MFSSIDQLERRCSRVKFTCQISIARLSGKVLLWLLHMPKNGGGIGKEKALDAIVAFWLPYALSEQGHHSPSEVQDTARFAIRRLEEQIWHLRSYFGVEMEPNKQSSSTEVVRQPQTVAENKSSLLTSLPELAGQKQKPAFQLKAHS